MIVHCFSTHARDAWCVRFHLRVYLSFCDRVIAVVDGSPDEFAAHVAAVCPERITVLRHGDRCDGAEVFSDRGIAYDEPGVRQLAIDAAVAAGASLVAFGDSDEVPTPDVIEWIQTIAARPHAGAGAGGAGERWYAHWVNLWGDYRHAIGGGSAWSFQNPRGNKKCLAMQVRAGDDLRYAGGQHSGMEPGRPAGGAAPIGPGRYLVDAPRLLHLKYAASNWATRADARLARHSDEAFLRGGEIVPVPPAWLWRYMPA